MTRDLFIKGSFEHRNDRIRSATTVAEGEALGQLTAVGPCSDQLAFEGDGSR